MSSMVNQAIEMGIDPVQAPGGGTWDDPHNRDYACNVARNRGFTPDYLNDDINNGSNCRTSRNGEEKVNNNEPEWFATAQEAQNYAKRNAGVVITRSPDGNGYIIKNNNIKKLDSMFGANLSNKEHLTLLKKYGRLEKNTLYIFEQFEQKYKLRVLIYSDGTIFSVCGEKLRFPFLYYKTKQDALDVISYYLGKKVVFSDYKRHIVSYRRY